MLAKQRAIQFFCGLFTSVTAIIDWYLNAPLRLHPLSVEESYHYEMFLERPRRVLVPPDSINEWWVVVLAAIAMFFLGYVASLAVMKFYQSRFITIQTVYLKISAVAGVIMGSCGGFLFFSSAFMFPSVWKIYLSILTALLTFLGTYLIFRSPYHIFLLLRQKRLCS